MADAEASRAHVLAALERNADTQAQQKAHEMRGKVCPIQRPMKDRWRP